MLKLHTNHNVSNVTIMSSIKLLSLAALQLYRSIGVSNFNIHHLEHLKLAHPSHIPSGESDN